MSARKMLRSASVTSLAALTTLAAAPTAPQARPAIRDGVPTPAACEALGFPAQPAGYGGALPRQAYRAAPMPAPPPMSLPRSVEELRIPPGRDRPEGPLGPSAIAWRARPTARRG